MGNYGKSVRAEGRASERALRSEYAWYVQGTRRSAWGRGWSGGRDHGKTM